MSRNCRSYYRPEVKSFTVMKVPVCSAGGDVAGAGLGGAGSSVAGAGLAGCSTSSSLSDMSELSSCNTYI